MAIPIGTITAYAGTIASIPEDWALCDGNNGTTNLVDRFIQATTTDKGATGGKADATLIIHGHTASFSGSPLPTHTHGGSSTYVANAQGGGGSATFGMINEGGCGQTSGGTPSGSVTVANGGVDGVGRNNPPFVRLIYIQKIA